MARPAGGGETATAPIGTGAGTDVSAGKAGAGVRSVESALSSIARTGAGTAARGAGEGPGLFIQNAPRRDRHEGGNDQDRWTGD